MKLVSWMACWRRCSPALPSREREDRGKQVPRHKQRTETLQSVRRVATSSVSCEAHPFRPFLCVSVCTQQQSCLCSLFLFHLSHSSGTAGCGSLLWPWQQAGKADSTDGLAQQIKREGGGVPRMGVGSRINWWGVVVGLGNGRGI